MGDWKTNLSKYSSGTGGGAVKKCKSCGKTINPGFDLCRDCNQKARSPETAPQAAKLPDGYLEGGYFNGKGNLKERYIAKDGDADIIAKQLGLTKPAMTNHQLRRFYGHVRAAATRLDMTGNFPAVYIDLKKLDPFVSEAKGKGKIPDLFYDFMIKNLKAIRPDHKEDFTYGFLEHFQAVVAFFTFHYPKK